MKILVTGASGLFGPYMMAAAAKRGEAIGLSRSGTAGHTCDLTDEASVHTLFREIEPDVVIHAAALSFVEPAEEDPQLADMMNVKASANVAKSCTPDCHLVYVSTDQVYGNVPGPHLEGTEAPINVYGRTKLGGEKACLGNHAQTFVARTSLFGHSKTLGRKSLDDFMAEGFAKNDGAGMTLFHDVLFTPLHMATLAEILLDAAEAKLTGTYNVASRCGFSKAEFGLAVARIKGLRADNARIGQSMAVPGRAKRPLDLRMDPSKFEQALGRPMPTLMEEVEKI